MCFLRGFQFKLLARLIYHQKKIRKINSPLKRKESIIKGNNVEDHMELLDVMV